MAEGDVPIGADFGPEHSWQWLRGRDGTGATTRTLKTCLELLQESFDPIIDVHTGAALHHILLSYMAVSPRMRLC